MKKLMLIATVLMIAGGVSAHGERGYDRDDRGREFHERVIVRPTYYNPYAVARFEPRYYNEYRRDCDRDRRYDRDRDDRYYRGRYDRDGRCR